MAMNKKQEEAVKAEIADERSRISDPSEKFQKKEVRKLDDPSHLMT